MLVGTALWAASAFGLLGAPPVYTATAAGQVKDEATFYVADFAFGHRNLWALMGRAVVYSLAFLGIIPIMLAVNALVGRSRARVQVAVGFFVTGAVLGLLYTIAWLAACAYWRSTGWESVPPELMMTVGRQVSALIGLSNMAGTASNTIFGVGLAYLGAACWSEDRLPRWMAPVAWFGAVCLIAAVAIGEVLGYGPPYSVLMLLGAVVLSVGIVGLGLHLGRGVRQPDSPTTYTGTP